MISNKFFHRCYCNFSQPFSCSYRRKIISSFGNYSTQKLLNRFQGVEDRFQGVTVDLSQENCDAEHFDGKLNDSLKAWSSEGKRCIWFKVNIKDAAHVPILAQKGFNFHHTSDDSLMMYKWLPKDTKANLPPASHTNLGVGALVLNKDNKLLAVSENSLNYPHWKLPGGYVDKGEDLISAAVREVREETGVECKFESVVTFRHTHAMNFGNCDLYVLMRMAALSERITPAPREIRACRWMDLHEYMNHPDVNVFNRLVIQKALEYKDKKIKLDLQKKTVSWWKLTREMHFLSVEDSE